MTLQELKYIIAVAENRHFGKAAERCFVSQPTLSGQIKKLEEELGVVIFERTNRSVEITPVGEAILAHARQILEQADSIRQLAQAQFETTASVQFATADERRLQQSRDLARRQVVDEPAQCK